VTAHARIVSSQYLVDPAAPMETGPAPARP
jgi:hypothetical protein